MLLLLALGCSRPAPEPPPAVPPEALQHHCDANIGEPRVEQIADGIWVAVGYDLANTTLIRTEAGNVVVDPGMSPARAEPARDALLEESPGPIAAVIYTHSHIDHVGGASAWVGEGTEIWATDALRPHFLEQYGMLVQSERRRGARQFGTSVPDAAVPCSALGRRPDISAALDVGAVLPTHAFSGAHTLEIGGVRIELVEAHGETHDQLFAWLPDERVLLPGDNWYRAFPNLYTVRGTRPRDVDAWIDSLDRMRALRPETLVPSHTAPVRGEDAVQHELTVYRDGIQFVRDSTIRGANLGWTVDRIAAETRLPDHLASESALLPLYGEVEWSVRAIYGNRIGWFDGRVDHLYPLPPDRLARNAIDAMGGPDAVRALAEQTDDPQWALTLIGWLRDDGRAAELDALEARAARALAETEANSNGRAYLLQSAREAETGPVAFQAPKLGEAFIDDLPAAVIFEQLPARLDPSAAVGVHEAVVVELTDEATFTLVVRHGICEVSIDEPLPGTPEPIARLVGSSGDFKRLVLSGVSSVDALTAFEVQGSKLGLLGFFARFEQGL